LTLRDGKGRIHAVHTPGHATGSRARLLLVGLGLALLAAYGRIAQLGPALADEYVYLAGARHFAHTGSLDARFYDARAILAKGHPHQDVHSPGYIILLGSLTAVVKGGYSTAVGLNAVAYLAGAILVCQLSRGLGFGERAAWLAGALYLIVPAHLPFVFWAMPEVVLGTLFLGALVLAVQWGDRTWAAVLAGVVLGVGLLVRESVAFGAPAVWAAFRDGGRRSTFLATVALFVVLVHVPLSRERAPGAVNFWRSPVDARRPGGFAAWHAARDGAPSRVLSLVSRNALGNLAGRSEPTPTEKAMLVVFMLLPLWGLSGGRSSDPLARRCLLALGVGWVALVTCLFALFVVGRWAGFRYLMFLVPAFLPWAARTAGEPGPAAARWAFPMALTLASVAVQASVLRIHNEYKASRQRRQEALTGYVERYVGARRLSRLALPNGWQFGLLRYPAEVISSLPRGGGELRALERAVWFDYLVLPGDSPLAGEWEGRVRYLRVNPEDPEPPLKIYRRLR
jgi:hypothetical protein